eukprot:745758-Hanusia_phi.AAC.3
MEACRHIVLTCTLVWRFNDTRSSMTAARDDGRTERSVIDGHAPAYEHVNSASGHSLDGRSHARRPWVVPSLVERCSDAGERAGRVRTEQRIVGGLPHRCSSRFGVDGPEPNFRGNGHGFPYDVHYAPPLANGTAQQGVSVAIE